MKKLVLSGRNASFPGLSVASLDLRLAPPGPQFLVGSKWAGPGPSVFPRRTDDHLTTLPVVCPARPRTRVDDAGLAYGNEGHAIASTSLRHLLTPAVAVEKKKASPAPRQPKPLPVSWHGEHSRFCLSAAVFSTLVLLISRRAVFVYSAHVRHWNGTCARADAEPVYALSGLNASTRHAQQQRP